MENFQKIRDLARHAREREMASRELLERMESRLLMAHGGGMWRVDTTLIAFLDAMRRYGDELVLRDIYDAPRKVRVPELLDAAAMRYQEVLNEWHADYAKAMGAR